MLALAVMRPAVAFAADEGMSDKDKKFMKEAALGGMLEVKLGDLASRNGNDQSVKEFGQLMVLDHGAANDQLKALAQSKNVELPADIDSKGQKTFDKLSKESGADFDKAYVKDMIKDHEKDIKEFQKEAKDGKDPDVKKFAEDHVPVLQKHLEHARAAAEKVGVKVASADYDKAEAQPAADKAKD